MQEKQITYKVLIRLPDGKLIMHKVKATTFWHAIDIAYSEYSDKQDDRAHYTTWPSLERN